MNRWEEELTNRPTKSRKRESRSGQRKIGRTSIGGRGGRKRWRRDAPFRDRLLLRPFWERGGGRREEEGRSARTERRKVCKVLCSRLGVDLSKRECTKM